MSARRFRFPLAVIGTAAATLAVAGERHYGEKGSKVDITYDSDQWEASEVVGNPYFTCMAEDCSTATCMVVAAVSPEFAEWPRNFDKASLDALTRVFLNEQKSGHADAEVVQPTTLAMLGGRETLVTIIATKSGGARWLSPRYFFQDASGPRLVICEGDDGSVSASRERMDALVGAIKFKPQ